MTANQKYWYAKGLAAFNLGEPDVNPLGPADMMNMCAWSAGYFDAKRGMV